MSSVDSIEDVHLSMRLFWHFREYHYITCDFYKNHHYCISIYIYALFQICFAVLPICSGQWKLWLDMFHQQMSISKTYNRDVQKNIIIQPAPQGKVPEIGSQEPHKSSQKSQILCGEGRQNIGLSMILENQWPGWTPENGLLERRGFRT